MRPLTIINLLLLGTAVSISLSLSVVALLFVLLAPKYPQMGAEIGTLFKSTALFYVLTALCGVSFIGLLRERRWRWVAQAAMWAGLVVVVWYFLPD